MRVDLNFDGDYLDAGETGEVITGTGGGFRYVTPVILDDGLSSINGIPANGTPSDSLNAEALPSTNVNQDSEHKKITTAATIYNVDPYVVAETPDAFLLDDDGSVVSATVTGSFTDPGVNDYHHIEVIWGDGVVGNGDGELIEGSPGEFSVTRTIAPEEDIYFWSLFPILVSVYDDDTGVRTTTVTDDGGGSCGCTDECSATSTMANATQLVQAQAQQQQQGAIEFEGIRPNAAGVPQKVVTDTSVEKPFLGNNPGVGGGILLGQATPDPPNVKYVLGVSINAAGACSLIEHNVEMPIAIELALNAKAPDGTLVPVPDEIRADVKAHEQKHVDSFQEKLWFPKAKWVDPFNAKLNARPAGPQRAQLASQLAQFLGPKLRGFLKKVESFEMVRQSLHLDHLSDHPYITERNLNGQWIVREKAGTYDSYLTLQDIKNAFNTWHIPGLAEATTKADAITKVNNFRGAIVQETVAILAPVFNSL